MKKVIPAISIIIPMYNVEKYIGDCLNSVLEQTFQDFEVILVDDCSTDNSRQIAESFSEKFGGRLKIFGMEKNSGVALSRNKGSILSRGEYVFFVDSDDMVTKTGLEEMYSYAQKFNADVIHTTKNYVMEEDGSGIKLMSNRGYSSKDEVFMPDISDRVQIVIKNKLWCAPWRFLIKRDLLIENEIFSPDSHAASDQVLSRCLFLCAKKLLIVPVATCLYRKSENSITRTKMTPERRIQLWVEIITAGIECFEKTLDKLEFFQEHPEQLYDVIRQFALSRLKYFFKASDKFSYSQIYVATKNVFDNRIGERTSLVSMLLLIMRKKYIEAENSKEKLNDLYEQAQKRIAELEEQLKNK
ncbi:MAG: glycosyltransferase family 2 protein [Selenomonadaceae bacterium]|nr:glycosyltransferase family 2 protein [Selenomonadaceae bacterium]